MGEFLKELQEFDDNGIHDRHCFYLLASLRNAFLEKENRTETFAH